MRNKLIIGTLGLFSLTAFGCLAASARSTVPEAREEISVPTENPAVDGQMDVPAVQVSEIAREMMVEEQNADKDAAAAELAQTEAQRKIKQQEKARAAAENDSHGFAITLIAMVIVIAALVILSLLFLVFGKISSSLQKARKRAAHGVNEENAEEHHDELDSGEVIAAISMALAEHLGQGHDIEDTILTIRRMRRSYSPWNSKIYNMRHLPGLTHAPHNPRDVSKNS